MVTDKIELLRSIFGGGKSPPSAADILFPSLLLTAPCAGLRFNMTVFNFDELLSSEVDLEITSYLGHTDILVCQPCLEALKMKQGSQYTYYKLQGRHQLMSEEYGA
uniref:Uncharacterized protein n=1 Tax=Glossina palpalis gambiensis TaxID=67801 RepID=A0A1B0B367_9MUSC